MIILKLQKTSWLISTSHKTIHFILIEDPQKQRPLCLPPLFRSHFKETPHKLSHKVFFLQNMEIKFSCTNNPQQEKRATKRKPNKNNLKEQGEKQAGHFSIFRVRQSPLHGYLGYPPSPCPWGKQSGLLNPQSGEQDLRTWARTWQSPHLFAKATGSRQPSPPAAPMLQCSNAPLLRSQPA